MTSAQARVGREDAIIPVAVSVRWWDKHGEAVQELERGELEHALSVGFVVYYDLMCGETFLPGVVFGDGQPGPRVVTKTPTPFLQEDLGGSKTPGFTTTRIERTSSTRIQKHASAIA